MKVQLGPNMFRVSLHKRCVTENGTENYGVKVQQIIDNRIVRTWTMDDIASTQKFIADAMEKSLMLDLERGMFE